jgi:endogenous inhibitor of DNA gyrase (YacG/DUF329 family)
MSNKKSCPICGSEFESSREHRGFCSKECAYKHRLKLQYASAHNKWISDESFRKERSKYNKQLLLKLRNEAFDILGKNCILCSRTENLRFHELNFQRHEKNPRYILNHPDSFVVLCQRCHLGSHFLHEIFGLSWKQILELR